VNSSSYKILKIALIGNPNTGKSSLFNSLTGLNQHIGNFPGITVDKKVGYFKLPDKTEAKILDLPGTYSLFPKSIDEEVAVKVLCNSNHDDFPDVTIVVADATNLKRSLFLCSQVIDLKIPVVLALNMVDLAKKNRVEINIDKLSELLGVPVVAMNARESIGIEELKSALQNKIKASSQNIVEIDKLEERVIKDISNALQANCVFASFIVANNLHNITYYSHNIEKREEIKKILELNNTSEQKLQALESIERYRQLTNIISQTVSRPKLNNPLTKKLDDIFMHKVWGYIIFLFILFTVFQAIFTFAALPMELIETGFSNLSSWLLEILPKGIATDLFINGILAGLGGIVIFIPQIALLFAFISILEDTGYMSRVSFIMDKAMRRYGLNGRSVIPLISGVACAVPAIMGARTISNYKERLLTIFVTPLMSCSARLPVYTLLIALAVPSKLMFGFFNLQGLVLMSLYLVGFFAAIGSAFVFKYFLKSKEASYFIMEMPVYRKPRWKNVGLTILEKVKVFLFESGKIILAVSVILWFLASFAPNNKFEQLEKEYNYKISQLDNSSSNAEVTILRNELASKKLEYSYAGVMGKTLEPIIEPLGFDWKIGISLVTSFAAREVFVGTMATIYSVGANEENTQNIREKMRIAKNPNTGEQSYTFAVAISLMLFYAFAMQCMSTIAVVYRETKSWKIPLFQFLYMGALAYLASYAAFNLLK
jgi:ferrous iron transport protein B